MKLIDIKIQALLKLWWIACCFNIFRQKSREFLDAAFMHSADVFHPTFFEEFFSTSATTVKHSKWDYFPNNLLSLEREKKIPDLLLLFFWDFEAHKSWPTFPHMEIGWKFDTTDIFSHWWQPLETLKRSWTKFQSVFEPVEILHPKFLQNIHSCINWKVEKCELHP